MKTKKTRLVSLLAFFAGIHQAAAQGTAFSYQGQLNAGGSPANGLYDMQFTVWDAPTNGNPVAGPLTNYATGVTNGLFAVTLDFGGGVFSGSNYWLDISVQSSNAAQYTELAPRQAITPVPYALYAANAQTAASAKAVAAGGSIPLSALPTGVLTNGATGVSVSGAFIGDGGGLTNLNGSALTAIPAGQLTGTLPDSTLPNALLNPATNSFWLPWVPTNYFSGGQTIITPTGFLFENVSNGTSGLTPPSGGTAVTNGSNVWLPCSSAFITNLPMDIPGVYTTFAQHYPMPPSTNLGSNYLAYFSYTNTNLGYGNHAIFNSNVFSLTGGFTWPRSQTFGMWASFAAAPYGPYGVYGTWTNFGVIAGWTAQGRVSFYTDAPLVVIGPHTTAGSGAVGGLLGNLYVDDVLVFPETIDGPQAYGTNVDGCFINFDFHGVRKARKISFYWTPNTAFPGVLIDKQSSLWPVPRNFTMYVEGCSFEQGGGDMPDCYGDAWPARLGRLIGCENTIVGAVGGTGFTNSAGITFYSAVGSNAIPDSYLGRVNLVISNNPNLVIVSGSGNDAASVGSSNSIYATNLAWLQAVRAGLPLTPIVELALVCNGSGTNAANVAMMQAMSNAVVAFGDSNTWFIDGTRWITGTGCVSATNGMGNADFYTGRDGVHPTDFGAEFIADKMLEAMEAVFGSPAQMRQQFTPMSGANLNGLTPGQSGSQPTNKALTDFGSLGTNFFMPTNLTSGSLASNLLYAFGTAAGWLTGSSAGNASLLTNYGVPVSINFATSTLSNSWSLFSFDGANNSASVSSFFSPVPGGANYFDTVSFFAGDSTNGWLGAATNVYFGFYTNGVLDSVNVCTMSGNGSSWSYTAGPSRYPQTGTFSSLNITNLSWATSNNVLSPGFSLRASVSLKVH